VSSRTRLRAAGISHYLPEHHVGQAAFERAHGFHRGFPGGDFSVVIGAAFGGVAELDHGHDVQHAVDLPVPGAGQAVPDVVAGGGIDRRGPVPGGEVAPVGEPGYVTDLH
jgi:hypothetical protein